MNNPSIKPLLTIIILFLSPQLSLGQSRKMKELKKGVKIDTLYVFLQFKEPFDPVLQKELLIQFDTLSSTFNREKQTFKLIIDSTRDNRAIKFLLSPIKYVDLKKNLWVTALDMTLIGVNILLIPYFPPVIPFYLMPATISRIDIKRSADILIKPTHLFINPNGYWTQKEKQKLKFKKQFNKVIYRYFLSLNKKNSKL
jgi:hypothetical protein